MPYIARREGRSISASFVGGDLTVIHEADNGILVVRLPRRKHWKDGEPDIPVRYRLARLYTGEDAVKARSRTICNSAHYADRPDVIEMIGRDVVASTHWRAVRAEMVAKAEAHAA
jgi:hypothetical protein